MLKYPNFSFEITHKDPKSRARLGQLKTPHGTIETPNYIFCGTKATVKNMTPQALKDVKTDIILSNTYHLMLQPGADLIERMGGIHKFMGWDGPMLTDSGGFQVFSLGSGVMADEIKGRNKGKGHENSSLVKIREEGVVFRSHIDGRKIALTPESAMDIQRQIGADLLMQFDECTPYHVTREYTARSMEMSQRWGNDHWRSLLARILVRRLFMGLFKVAFILSFARKVRHGHVIVISLARRLAAV